MMLGVTGRRLREDRTSEVVAQDSVATEPLRGDRGLVAALLSPAVLLILAAFAAPLGLLLSSLQVCRARRSGVRVEPLVWLALGVSALPMVATVVLFLFLFFVPF